MRGESPGTRARGYVYAVWPGLLVAALGAAAGYVVHWFVPGIHQGSAAVALGALAVNLGVLPDRFDPGIRVAATKLLRLGVVLLGFGLSVDQVAELGWGGLFVVLATVGIAFGGTLAIAKMLKMRRATGLLVASGFSICGASAIAAMEPVARGKKDDTAIAVVLVTLCGSLAIVVLPLLAHPLGLDDPVAFGSWVGASVHDVGQTIATAHVVPGALHAAVVVKLTRVIMLAPMVVLVGLVARRSSGPRPEAPGARPPLVPLFVGGFLAAIVLVSVLDLPVGLLDVLHRSQEIALTVALFALGTTIRWKVLRRAGGRPLVLGLLSWLLVAGVAYGGILLVGQ